MAFPVVESTSEYADAWNPANQHTFSLPSGIQTDDVILVLVKTHDSATVTIAGFTEIAHHKFSRVADGTEGSDVTVVSTMTHRASIVGYRISGADTSEAVEIAEAELSSSSPEVVASWGSRDNLFVAVLATDAGDQTVSPPSNYSNVLTSGDSSSATTRNRIWSAHRQLAAASDTPGAWTVNSGTLNFERAYTLVVAGPQQSLAAPVVSIDSTTNPTGPDTNDGQADVSWGAVTGAATYRVELASGLDATTGFSVVEESHASTSITLTGLDEGDWTVGVTAKP